MEIMKSVFVILSLALSIAGAQTLSGPKQGSCRHLVPGIRERARCHPDLCQRDTDCPGIELCCFDGCAKACSRPVWAKPGNCPPLNGRVIDRSVLGGRPCSHDFNCPERQKCCQLSRNCATGNCPFICALPQKGPH